MSDHVVRVGSVELHPVVFTDDRRRAPLEWEAHAADSVIIGRVMVNAFSAGYVAQRAGCEDRLPFNDQRAAVEYLDGKRRAMTMTTLELVCDATLCTDSAGIVGRVDVVTIDGDKSVPVGACSNDRALIYHGMEKPAVACGKHAQSLLTAVFRGHHNRVATSSGS